ncbi:E motif [Dillenia turbinata]|uniref:E motif n=1 Tax=Dillenia turbinata TaxID=194707 RepID=A0AAN8VXA3_9MAGN
MQRIAHGCLKNHFHKPSSLQLNQFLQKHNKPTNGHVIVYLIRACAKFGSFSHGQQLHCNILRSGYDSNAFISTSLIAFYVGFECLNDAKKMFDEIPHRNVVSWNTLISGYMHSGQCRKALSLFGELNGSDVSADPYSFTPALAACGKLGLSQLGMSIHSMIVKHGLEFRVFVANCLIDMYGKCGFVEEAIGVFYEMTDRDTISFNSVISACARTGRLEEAHGFLNQMPCPDTISYNELINGYAQFRCMEDAVRILSIIPNPNSSSWNSIITGYVNQEQAGEALDFFIEMHKSGIQMDQYTFSSILSGIARLSALKWGELTHSCTIKCGLDAAIVIGSALIDMYSKCGQVIHAEALFRSLHKKNLVTWNAMISGFAHNGHSDKVIELFNELQTVKGLKPDGITFLNVLSACRHMPLETVVGYLELMTKEYRIDPMPEHCSSVIRVMGTKGEVWRAEKLIYDLGFGSCGLVWRALLGACLTCWDLEVAEIAAAKVIELEGDKEYVFVMMSKIYAYYGKWVDAVTVRKLMKERGVRKDAGRSWIEVPTLISTK